MIVKQLIEELQTYDSIIPIIVCNKEGKYYNIPFSTLSIQENITLNTGIKVSKALVIDTV